MKFDSMIVTPISVIVTIDGKVCSATKDHPNFDGLKQALRDEDADRFLSLYDVKKSLAEFVDTNNAGESIVVNGDRFFYKGEELNNDVVNSIRQMMLEGFKVEYMIRFLERWLKNPSYNSRQEMWNFIGACGLTITPDGCFLAYKAVDSNYKDKYSGSVDNTPGSKPKRMERCDVDDNPKNHCSKGYHVGALAYAGPGGFYHNKGDITLICKVDPADVVSVPNDYSCRKLRCCYYEPVGVYDGTPMSASVYSGEVGDDYGKVVATPAQSVADAIDEYDLCEDQYYIGEYTGLNGETKTRYFIVEAIDTWRDMYTVQLVKPEVNAGEYRSFLMDNLDKVYTWDGESDPDEVNSPYDSQCDCNCQCNNQEMPW